MIYRVLHSVKMHWRNIHRSKQWLIKCSLCKFRLRNGLEKPCINIVVTFLNALMILKFILDLLESLKLLIHIKFMVFKQNLRDISMGILTWFCKNIFEFNNAEKQKKRLKMPQRRKTERSKKVYLWQCSNNTKEQKKRQAIFIQTFE